MIKVGITGGIGSGKTTVCKVFELLGIPVFYSDQVAREVMLKDALLIEQIKSSFGAESYLAEGGLNRKYLSSIVFNNEQKLEALNALVHPAVFRAFDHWVEDQSSAYVVKEAAILFESGSYLDCHYTILVSAPENVRIQRVIARDSISEEEVKRRISKQMPEPEKMKLASHTLLNDESCLLIPQILELHQQFLNF